MRTLPLFENGGIRFDAGQRLLTFNCFPEDEASREQLYQLIEFEKLRAMEVGPQLYEETGLSKIVSDSLNRSEGQKGVAALVTLCLAVLLKSQKKRPTLYAAASMAAKVMKEQKMQEGHPFFKTIFESGDFVKKGVKAVSGRGDIEKRFRTFNSIGTIKCAALLMSENTSDKPFPQNLEADIPRLLQTIAEVEKTVVDTFPEYFPDPWRIGSFLPREVKEMEPFNLNQNIQGAFGISSLW